jgi:outer membrane lipoprotein carrier protein
MRSTKILLALTLLSAPLHADPRVPGRRPAQRAAQQPRPQITAPRTPAAPRPATAPAAPRPATASATPRPATTTAPATNAAAPNAPAQNAANPAQQIAQQIQAFYDRTTDFSADFVQVSRNRLYGEERRTGQVIFRKPGRMRWNYAAPSGDVIVSDGRTLWAYQADERQAVQQQLGQSQLPTAITFLAGTGRLTDSFTFRLLDANQFRFPQGHVLELRPTTPQPSYERIIFYVDRASYQVVRTAVIDAQGNQNRFDFSNPRVNTNVPEATFQWTPPAGTSIVRP